MDRVLRDLRYDPIANAEIHRAGLRTEQVGFERKAGVNLEGDDRPEGAQPDDLAVQAIAPG